ncbi:Uncharacterized protein YtpQ, UPF0354 family [Alteribacillus persepolensis]|uniref:Uncharacterized protein YtpQ, UPF0354 family n=1 Tax=Alteribacillus persepolensis TaxID=568899 RepID=A0A1G8BCE1_9BACI|nr:DUF1444 family protein [Alteribacillus persepolensis]SDH30885.1 Uncharacterized protein YtpQ, UPF0354 family [Alteribacillus persepolensis]
MDIIEFKNRLEKRLTGKNRSFSFDKEKSMIRVDHTALKKGVELDVNKLLAKHEKNHEQALEDAVHYINSSFEAMEREVTLKGKEKYIYPVIRSTSFPEETKEGKKLLYTDHTAETRIYYALDMGEAYTMLEEEIIVQEGFTPEEIKEAALFNIRSVSNSYKKDEVAGNIFYFVNTNDGYDASRILNETFVEEMDKRMEGDTAIAVPHQDVLIFADIRNQQGYDILGQLSFRFFSNGRVPITALPFLYENAKLEPIFILARKKPSK